MVFAARSSSGGRAVGVCNFALGCNFADAVHGPEGTEQQNIFASTRGVLYYTHVVRRAHTRTARASAAEMHACVPSHERLRATTAALNRVPTITSSVMQHARRAGQKSRRLARRSVARVCPGAGWVERSGDERVSGMVRGATATQGGREKGARDGVGCGEGGVRARRPHLHTTNTGHGRQRRAPRRAAPAPRRPSAASGRARQKAARPQTRRAGRPPSRRAPAAAEKVER